LGKLDGLTYHPTNAIIVKTNIDRGCIIDQYFIGCAGADEDKEKEMMPKG
jgi:hypothetical protein